eukprot:1182431-Prorocentrum_minimum.AAC.1
MSFKQHWGVLPTLLSLWRGRSIPKVPDRTEISDSLSQGGFVIVNYDHFYEGADALDRGRCDIRVTWSASSGTMYPSTVTSTAGLSHRLATRATPATSIHNSCDYSAGRLAGSSSCPSPSAASPSTSSTSLNYRKAHAGRQLLSRKWVATDVPCSSYPRPSVVVCTARKWPGQTPRGRSLDSFDPKPTGRRVEETSTDAIKGANREALVADDVEEPLHTSRQGPPKDRWRQTVKQTVKRNERVGTVLHGGSRGDLVVGARSSKSKEAQRLRAPLLSALDAALAAGDHVQCLACVRRAVAETPPESQAALMEALGHRHMPYLAVCVKARQLAPAFDYVAELPPSSRLYHLLVRACADLADYPAARRAFDLRGSAGLVPDSFAYSGLISAAGKAGQLEEARFAFRCGGTPLL